MKERLEIITACVCHVNLYLCPFTLWDPMVMFTEKWAQTDMIHPGPSAPIWVTKGCLKTLEINSIISKKHKLCQYIALETFYLLVSEYRTLLDSFIKNLYEAPWYFYTQGYPSSRNQRKYAFSSQAINVGHILYFSIYVLKWCNDLTVCWYIIWYSVFCLRRLKNEYRNVILYRKEDE